MAPADTESKATPTAWERERDGALIAGGGRSVDWYVDSSMGHRSAGRNPLTVFALPRLALKCQVTQMIKNFVLNNLLISPWEL